MVTLELLNTWVSVICIAYGVYWVLPFSVKGAWKRNHRPRELSEAEQSFIKYLVDKFRVLYDQRIWVIFALSLVGTSLMVELYIPGYGAVAFIVYLVLCVMVWLVYDDYCKMVQTGEKRKMIDNEFFSKLMKIPAICGWSSTELGIEEYEDADNQIYVSSDINSKKIDEDRLYSSLHSIISECEELLGDLLKNAEVLENQEETGTQYHLILRVSIVEASKRPEQK